MTMRICLVAAPLIARSGVYNSVRELVECARAQGLPWKGVLGVSADAGGSPKPAEGIDELALEPRGIPGIATIRSVLRSRPACADADLVISLTPQTDMALSALARPWVAYLRGLPWPASGESSNARRLVWRALEQLAMRRAAEVWATTPTLAQDVGDRVTRIVPPGVADPAADLLPEVDRGDFVWAARFSVDKNPELFGEALRGTSARGVMYGSGPLEQRVAQSVPANVRVAGWIDKRELWRHARAYVGTSTREAFGRSAVEAAMLGLPVVISSSFGCADLLFTDPELAAQFVISPDDVSGWRDAIRLLDEEPASRERLSGHVQENAAKLTIAAAVGNIRAAVGDL